MQFALYKRPRITAAFLLAELVLYILILTCGGSVLTVCSYLSVVLCFLYAGSMGKNGDLLIIAGLGCTVGADFFLVICDPVQRLWGMVFFMGTQILYAVRLHRDIKRKGLICLRVLIALLAVSVTLIVLKDSTDALALISLCYYANLIMNIAVAFFNFRKEPVFPIALVLFLLCDTVIGLQVASGSYLAIREDSILYRLIFMDFNLAWFFYLPSQILIALCGAKRRAK